MPSIREVSAITKKQLALREMLWPGAEPMLWNRKENKGFATIPKTLPIILNIMDDMTKGAPVSSTYLALWCATWDNSFVNISRPGDLSHAAGFGGQRGEHTWATRMRKLKELGFIDIKPGKSGAMSHAIIFNPHFVLRELHARKTPGLTEANYTALVECALDIGAKDMLEETPIPGMAPPEKPKPAHVKMPTPVKRPVRLKAKVT